MRDRLTMNGLLALSLCVVLVSPAVAADRKQLRTLGSADKPRFQVTARVWPDSPDQPSICLWEGDKLAAFCFGVDDNWFSDVEWWLAQQQKYGYPCTWFLITGKVGTSPSFNGTWADWQKVCQAGNDVQSHTVTHLHAEVEGYKGVEWDYTDAIKQIESNLPGHKVLTLAYPGGKNSKLNSRDLAAEHYICARGTRGILNRVDQVDYLNVNATRLHAGDNPKAPWGDIHQLLDPNSKMFRGWGFYFTHKVDREKATLVMDYLKANAADVWVALYTQQAQYAQERDTAKISDASATAEQIKFTVHDDMHDDLFDYPLTIKVRLPNGWTGAAAKQAGKDAKVQVIDHGGAKFALVPAVPDRGEVILSAK